MPTGIPIPAPSATLLDFVGRGFAVAVESDGWITGVAVVGDVWELDVSVDCNDDEEADETDEVACEDDEVVEVEDSEDVDGVGDDPAPDDLETALTTVMVE